MKQIYLHPLPVRIWHWVNAGCFFVLIVTGLQIRYRDLMQLMDFRAAVDVHNFFGFALIINFMLWLVYYRLNGKIRIYIPDLHPARLLRSMVRQARFYGYGIFRGEANPHHPSPDHKFNPMQQMAYLSLMVILLPLQIVSGLLLWDLKGFAVLIGMVGGVKAVSSVHVLLNMFFIAFLYVHIYLTTLGRSPMEHIRAMVTGFEDAEEQTSH
jgi:thiosulfate reductase cytochrome b subunit